MKYKDVPHQSADKFAAEHKAEADKIAAAEHCCWWWWCNCASSGGNHSNNYAT
jgi:hypothetical protein